MPNAYQHERGQVVVFFAVLLPALLALGGVVIGAGNWFVHAKHLQTKADAGALAGGGQWEFPCDATIDGRIADTARLYAGANNPQVGGVPNADVKVRLNALDWYDDDSNPGQGDFDSPNGSVCSAMTLDVKVTEDNSFPLASLIPLFPDVKRKARVEIQQSPGGDGILPIAVRAPEPASAAAVFYNEDNGAVLEVKYLVKSTTISGLPGSLQGWTTLNPQDLDTLARLNPPAETTGVVMAISYRGACDTNLPPGNTNITTSVAPCFEDEGFTNINTFCNQGVPRVASCYYATGDPAQTVQSGLHFIRGFPSTTPGNGPPGLEEAYLQNLGCSYFSQGNTSCSARLHVTINLGTLNGQYSNPSPPPAQITAPLKASDLQVRYCKVTVASNNNNACNWGNSEVLTADDSDDTGTVSFSTGAGTNPSFAAKSGRNAFAIQVQLRNAQNHTNTDCRNAGFNGACRYRYTAAGPPTTNDLTRDEILAAPIQRAFRGTLLTAGSTRWLRLTRSGCPGGTVYMDNEAGMAPQSSASCFIVDAGLKGGLALDADEPSVLFTDGTSSNQVGGVACNPGGQGPILKEAVKYGCEPEYQKHPFNYLGPDPAACPEPNDLFMSPNPGFPWDDGSWPPMRCIDTRQTGTGNQLGTGLNWRLFDNDNPNFGQCPPDGPGFVKGRNYWKVGTNTGVDEDGTPYGYKDDSPVHATHFDEEDPRLVTIFVSTPEAFAYSNDKTHPITGFLTVYITGFGTLGDAINGISEDPCPGGTVPPDIDDCSGNQCNNYVVWGHILKRSFEGPRGRPSGEICNPQLLDPCVPVLVE
jgi:hypothetical protein